MDNPFKKDWADIFFDRFDPESKRMKQFRSWLFQNKETEISLFHGTSQEVPAITEGLLPTSSKRRRSIGSTPGYLYLSIFPAHAKLFGELGYPQHQIVVYAVKIKIKYLRPDIDQLRNKRRYTEETFKDNLANSLVHGFGARTRCKAFPYQLTLLSKVHDVKEIS